MIEDDALDLVSALVVTTTGWNDDAVDATVALMVRRWHDVHAASEAVEAVMDSWQKQSRPTWGVLHDAYKAAVRRRALDTPAIAPGASGAPITAQEGRSIAARAYARECRNRPADDPHILTGWRSRSPNQATLDGLLGLVGSDTDDE